MNVESIRKWLTAAAAVLAAVLASLANVKPVFPPAQPPTTQPLPPAALPVQPPQVADALKAIGKIQFGNAGCSGTIIAPSLADRRWLILSAQHCVNNQPKKGVFITRDGKRFGIEVLKTDPTSDVAWMVTTEPHDEMPFAYLADDLPKAGDKVWHAGYGVDIPGNREDGKVVEPENSRGQTQFDLSVSSGDSGGGIAVNGQGKIISCVCCKNIDPRSRQMWGASILSIRKNMPTILTADADWTPIPVPEYKP